MEENKLMAHNKKQMEAAKRAQEINLIVYNQLKKFDCTTRQDGDTVLGWAHNIEFMIP